MRNFIGFSLLAAAVLAAPAADAAVTLFAIGDLDGSRAGVGVDLSGLRGPLENGLTGNILGGLGSGLAYAGQNTFIGVPDRGPNATPYNAAVDDTSSYISRMQTISMVLAPSGSGLPFTLTPTLTRTTLLSSPTALNYGTGAGLGTKIDGTPLGSGAPSINTANAFYFTGRSDNYGAGNSSNPANARFDPEAIRVSNDGRSVFISDEYGPYVRQFDRVSGELIKTFALPGNLDIINLSPHGATEIAGNTMGRTTNKGMEGLAITPDGKTLVGVMQAALLQDAAVKASKKIVRIVTIDIATGMTHEYAYQLTTGSGISDIVAINDHEFLLDERDGSGLGNGDSAVTKQFFKINLTGATDVTNLSGAALVAAVIPKSMPPFINLVAALNAAGISSDQIPSKIEGIAFGEDVLYNSTLYHTLFIANDNDFVPSVSGTNKFYVFGFQDSDLPGYRAQNVAAIPEPASWAMLIAGFGLVGGAMRRRATVTRSVIA